MNCIRQINHLHNRYFAMRHGHSLANRQRIIVSDPANGRDAYGLSDLGRRQVADSLESSGELDASTLIVSSDFRRALESARIVQQRLGCGAGPVVDARLRERFFGGLELGPDDGYEQVWREDAVNPDSEPFGVESANRVMRRVTELVVELDAAYRGRNILLVSHGDALQLLQTAFDKQDASRHRALDHLETAEIRLLALA
jgi:probable phosphoglycerate mutase